MTNNWYLTQTLSLIIDAIIAYHLGLHHQMQRQMSYLNISYGLKTARLYAKIAHHLDIWQEAWQ